VIIGKPKWVNTDDQICRCIVNLAIIYNVDNSRLTSLYCFAEVNNLNFNIRIALLIVSVTIAWFASGVLFENTVDGTEAKPSTLTKVQAEQFSEQKFVPQLQLRSYTAPSRTVDLRAQINGSVIAVPGLRGSLVNQGQIVCALDKEDREQRLKKSVAQLQQAEIAYSGALQLKTAGFQSDLAISQAKMNLEVAKLALERSQIDLENLNIKAPFSAIVEDRPVEVGDFLSVGQLCARLVELDPLKIVAQATESDVVKLKVGDKATANFDDYGSMDASLTYIGYESNPKTRSYLVEAQMDNTDLSLRAGISGRLNLRLPVEDAHLIPSGLILLDSDGDVVVRAVDSNNRVVQTKVVIVGENKQGVWVKGLPKTVNLITVGQNYVSQGEQIEIYFASDPQ